MAFAPRLIPRIETWPGLVRFVQTKPGRLALVALFCVIFRLNGGPGAPPLAAALGAISLWPRYRRAWIALATLYGFLTQTVLSVPGLTWQTSLLGRGLALDLRYALAALCLGLAALLLQQARLRPESRIFRRPVRNLLVFYILLVLAASALPRQVFLPRLLLWSFVLLFGKYIWFIAYALLDRRRQAPPAVCVQLFHFQPFWSLWCDTNVPYPKGEAYLSRIEAKTPDEFALVQLKGLKLILWATALHGALMLFDQVLRPGVPTLWDSVQQYLGGHPFPRWSCWATVMANFCESLLRISTVGHFIISICRMAGFNALRNTCRPLSSSSIADFYNRVYFYFKELLVDFFFYPTYMTCFKKHPRLRLFFATMMAAGFGNVLYHFLEGLADVPRLGLRQAVAGFQVYPVYGLILGLAIAVSQLRSSGQTPSPAGKSWSATALVLLFYSLITILDEPAQRCGIADYGSFMLNLFWPFPR
jgi:hypothetical protein